MGLTPFDIVLPAAGQSAKILIDGVNVANMVTRVTVDCHSSDRIPQVFLEMKGEGCISGEGVVTQIVSADMDQRQHVVAFLSNLDPSTLEAAALEKLGGLGGMTTSTGEAFLEVLKEMVRGNNDGS